MCVEINTYPCTNNPDRVYYIIYECVSVSNYTSTTSFPKHIYNGCERHTYREFSR